ncbi:hypothetical protein AGMMS49574_10610 [Bacteroidia bacterium]|nr:hypothetical protein AGMMS49574_10610 [Bacteroidia bacterium]
MRKFLTVIGLLLVFTSVWGQRGDWSNDEEGFVFMGSGTPDDPYLISSVTALIYLADQANMWEGKTFEGVHFLLTNDLDLGLHYWIPIGSEEEQPFQGIFNGNNKVIHNLYIGSTEVENVFSASGLFGYLGKGARIENLTIEDGLVVGGNRETVSRTGAMAGYLLCSVTNFSDSIIIRNCHNKKVNVIGGNTEVSTTGGLIGEGYAFSEGGGTAAILLDNCSNTGAVKSIAANFPYTGGLVGKGRGHGYCDGLASATGSFLLRDCRNAGVVTGGDTKGTEAISSTGGILGFGFSSGDGYGNSDGSGVLTIEYCMNLGTVSGGDAGTPQAFSYTGGILGYADGYGYGEKSDNPVLGKSNGIGDFSVLSSANRGAIKGGDASDKTAVSSTGGILGFASASASTTSGGTSEGNGYGAFNMHNCYSYADISARKGVIGGLVGCLATIGVGANHQISAILTNSYAAGTINKGDTIFSVITGGIVGRMQKSKEANRSPQVANCLTALSYLNGGLNRTYRVVAQLQGISQPLSRILSRNYGFINEGEYVYEEGIQNGIDWGFSMLESPVANWDFKNKVWLVDEGQTMMPLLNNLSHQTSVPIP